MKVIASFPNSHKTDAVKSKERIVRLADGRNLYPGHGDAYIHYNGCIEQEATVEDTLRSVLTQTYPHIECIVVDGGSVDNTVSIIEKYVPLFEGRLKYISEADSGVYEAMNKGLRMAAGDVVGYLNSDDVFKDRYVIETIAQTFEKPEIDAVFGNVLYRKRNGERLLRRYSGNYFNPGMLPYGIMPPHPSFMQENRVI